MAGMLRTARHEMIGSVATYMDSRYLSRGLAMIQSLRRWCPEVTITVLCLDEQAERVVSRELGNRVRITSPAPLVAACPDLEAVRGSRTAWEYYATLKPHFVHWVLGQSPPGALTAYVDADCYFYSSPDALLTEAGDFSILITPHRYSWHVDHPERYGTFNAGFGIWRNDDEGRRCLADWAARCLAWCHAVSDSDGRYMNQGYLNGWPTRFKRLVVCNHPGANLAYWNIASHVIRNTDSGVTVDNRPLIFYHFSGIAVGDDGKWKFEVPSTNNDEVVVALYQGYLAEIGRQRDRLAREYGLHGTGSVKL